MTATASDCFLGTSLPLFSDLPFKVADLSVHIMGAAGYVQGDMQRLFRDARLGTIGGGTSDILRNVIAQRMEL